MSEIPVESSKDYAAQISWHHRPWWQRLVGNLAAMRLVSNLLRRYLHRLDHFILSLTGGKRTATGLMTGLPVIWLTTIGAKTAQLRRTPLVALRYGESWVLIASSLGSRHNPAWYYNLKANPRVTVSYPQSEHSTASYHAREVSESERARWWQRAVEMYPGYAKYQKRAGMRQIPVIILVPLGVQSDD